jgi:AhpC/TSA family
MRPDAADIAVPDFPPGIEWLGAKTIRVEMLLRGGPLMVWFWDFAQLNSLRMLPYLRRWHERYRQAGLRILGVHSPRYPFTAPAEAVSAAVRRLEVSFPVAVDSEFLVWRDYGNEGWPALFLWAPAGVLHWYHFGEGDYRGTEEALQELLVAKNPAFEPPESLPPLRPSDAADARVLQPSDEVLPGGSTEVPWEPTDGESTLELAYAGAGASAAIEGAGRVKLEVDGHPHEMQVESPGLYELSEHAGVHGEHRLRVTPAGGQRIYSVSFAPGVMPGGAEEEYPVD